MPAIDFPSAPAVNDEYSFEGRTWLWNGTGWEVKSYPAALQLGSASAPSLYFTGDPNTGLYSPGADQVAITTGGTGRLFIASDGKVGIGTTSPNRLLEVSGGIGADNFIRVNVAGGAAKSGIEFSHGGAAYAQLYYNNVSPYDVSLLQQYIIGSLIFGTNNTERARIDSSGRLLVGTSAARTNFSLGTATTQFETASSTFNQGLSIINNGGTVGYDPTLTLGTTRGTTIGSNTAITAADYGLGRIDFAGSDGTNLITGARIAGVSDGGWGTNDAPGRLVFSTTADGAASPTERMVIKADGKVGIGTSSPGSRLEIGGETSPRMALNAGGVGGAPGVLFQATGTTYGSMLLDTITSGELAIKAGQSGQNGYFLTFGTNDGTERARIDTSGRLLVGTSTSASANATVQVRNDSSSGTLELFRSAASTGAPGIRFSKSRGTSSAPTEVSDGDTLGSIIFTGYDGAAYPDAAYIQAFADGTWTDGGDTTDNPTRITFSTTADGASSPTEAMRINNQRELLIGTTTRTANGGVLQVSNGITFPATQSACTDVNTLDDYEEGTFTATIIGTTTAGTATYAVQNTRYTKIGRVVQIEILLNWSAGTGTGDLRISGLPFTSANSTTTPALAITLCSGITMTASHVMTTRVANNSTQIEFLSYPSGGGGYVSVTYDGEGVIGISGTYSV